MNGALVYLSIPVPREILTTASLIFCFQLNIGSTFTPNVFDFFL